MGPIDILTSWQVVLAVVMLNLSAFAAMAIDRRRTWYGQRRVGKSVILGLSALGGSLGTKLAQRLFRHMQLRQPFASTLNLIMIAQIVAVSGLAFVSSEPAMAWLVEHRATIAEDKAPTGPAFFGPKGG